MKYLRYLLFALILVLAPNAYAWDLSNKVEALPTFGDGTYSGQTATSPTAVVYNNIGTRYQGKLSVISFFLDSDDWDWNYDRTYSIELYMETNDWDNNFMYPQVYKAQETGSTSGSNLAKSSVSFISNKKIKFTFKTPDTNMSPYLFFRVYSSNYMTTGITRISNYNFNKVLIYENQSSSGGSSGGGSSTPTPTATPSSTEQIIDSSIKNTEDIINTQNQNTQDIIENANHNFEEATNTITNSMNDIFSNCVKNIFDPSLYVSPTNFTDIVVGDGSITANASSTWRTLAYSFEVENGEIYTLHYKTSSAGAVFYYDNNTGTWTSLGNDSYQHITTTSTTLNIRLQNSSGTGSFTWSELMLAKGNYNSYYPFGDSCVSKIDETNKEIKDLNDKLDGLGRVIEDSQVDDKSSFFTGFTDNSHGLTGIITLPLSTIQSITNTSCVALSIPIPFTNESVSLPCMTEVYQNYVPTVFSIWQVVSFGIISYFICIDIFKMVKGFKDPNEDKVEVLDL